MRRTGLCAGLGLFILLSGACSDDSPILAQQGGSLEDADKDSPAVVNGKLHVCGTRLCNEHGAQIQLRGMSTHGLQWYGLDKCLGSAALRSLADDWGADVLRLAMYVEKEAQGYLASRDRNRGDVTVLIKKASALGMYAIVDWHMLSSHDPRLHQEEAVEFFSRMAQEHGSRSNVIYEIANEPTKVTWDEIKEYAEAVIPAIREHAPDALILVGTPQWSSLGLSGMGSPEEIAANPIDDNNVMYTFHFYAGTHASYLPRVEAAADEIPIFVSEWGTQEATGDGANDFESAGAFLDMFERKKISWVNWNFSDDFRSGAVLKEGNCGSGPWTGEGLKESGTWVQDRMLNPLDDFPLEARATDGVGGQGGASER